MVMRQRQAEERAAFTLMEMLVVVAIIVVLAGAGIPIYLNYVDKARKDTAQRGVMMLESAVKAWMLSDPQGMAPPSLDVLAQSINGQRAALPISALQDPWGHPYQMNAQDSDPNTGVPLIFTQTPQGLMISN